MGPNSTEEARAFIQKVCNFTRKFCYRSASDHPFIVGMLCFSLFLYKFLPSLFFFLVSSSPVLVCTFVLLGTLLSFGDAYIPQVEEEEEVGKIHDDVSSLRSRGVGSDVVLEKDESFGLESFVEKSEGKDLIFEEKPDEGDGQGEEERPLIEVGNDGVGGYVVESDRGIEGVDFGFVQYSAISKRIDEEEEEESSEYDTDSDRAESSSPDASMAEIMPMLDELHPLLDSEPSQPVVASVEDDVDVDVASEESHSHRSSDGSEDDEVENAESADARERQGGHAGGTEAVVVTWTKEDEKNLMLLGNSELERNRRLESLIARRRARKNFRVMMAEKNLIDLDVGEPGFQIAPISTARRNPFDLHYDSNEGMELPPIPGSAPSVLAPRRNPFDIPYDPFEERPNLAGGSFEEEFFSSHEKDNIFRRHESFSAGSSIFGEPRPLKSASKLKPFFVPERLHPEVGYPTFQRQLSEISESKVSVTETESVSSASDQDSHKNKTEEESFETVARGEQELSQLMDHFEYSPEHAKLESSSLEVNLVETNRRDHNPLDMESVASPMGSDITVGSIITDVYVKCEAVEEKHIELGQTSSHMSEVLDHVNTNTGVEAREPETDNTYANNSAQLPVEDEQPMLHVGQEVSQSMGHVERAHDHSETESSSSEEIDLVEFDHEHHRDAIGDEGNAHERQSIALEMKSVASPMESDTTNFYLKPEVEEKHIELHSSSLSEPIEIIYHVNTSEALVDPEPKNDDTIGNSSMQPIVEDSSWMEGDGTQLKEPVYDWNWYPSGVEKTLSGISIVEEALAYGDTKGHISTSLLELDMPVEYPEVQATSLQVERTVSFVDDDNVLHHENIEEETTSGNDGLCNSSSDLPVAGENQLVEATMTSGHEVAEVGLPGDDQNDEYLQTPVLPSVTEQVLYDSSSSSSSSSSEGEFEDENSVTTETDVVDAAGPDNSGLLSEDPTHTMMETPPPLLEEAMLHESSDSYREESQEISSSVVVSTIESDANDEVVHGDVLKDASSHSFPTSVPRKISNNEPATREINFEDTLHDEIQHSRYSDDLEHSSFSQVQTDVEETDKEFNEIEEITEIEEGLLMELDAVGDFGTVELETNTNQMENPVVVNAQENLTGLQVLETDSSKDLGDKSNETVDSVEMVPDLQSSEPSVGEVHLTSKEILVDEIEGDGLTGVQVLEPNFSKDAEDQSQKTVDSEIPPYSQSFESTVGEVHSTLEQVSVDKVEGSSLSSLQALAPDSSNDIEDISQKTMDSMQVEPDLQNFEPRVQQVDLTSEHLSSDEMEDKSLAGLQVHESNSSKDVGDESHETVDSIEVLPELQSFEPIAQGEVLLTSEQLSMDETEDKSLARLQVHEPETSKDAEDESHKTIDSTEVLPDLEIFEPRVEGEVHLSTEQLSVEEMEDMSHSGSQVHESDSSKDVEYESNQTIDSFEVSSDVQISEPKAGEEHLATEERSVDKMEDKSVTGLQVLKPDSSKDVVDEFHQTIDSVEVLPDLPSFETRVEGEVHVASKEPSTDKMEDESLICPQVPKPDSSKDVEDESHQIIDSMEVVQDSQSSEPIAGDVLATSKEVPVDDELKPSEDSEMVMNSSIKANPDFEYALSEESKTSVDESKSVVEESKTSVDEKSGVEERQEATSSTIDVKKKKKGSTVSKSGSSSSSSSSDSD